MKLAICKFVGLFALALSLASCHSNKARIQSFRYHENAKQKPIVALIPLISRVQNPNVAWDISQEITAEIHRKIINRGKIFLNPVQLTTQLRQKLESHDLITLTIEDFKDLKKQNEFAIFMELLDHHETTSEPTDEYLASVLQDSKPNLLEVKVRVRVYDLRGHEPKIVLQEILHNQHFIPKVERDIDYHKVVWGGDSYIASVYGRAHAKLEKDLAQQIENYISISK